MEKDKKKLDLKELSLRASRSYQVQKIFKKSEKTDKVSKFLLKQKLVPFQNINNILSASKNDKFPIGSIMILKKTQEIIGFVGTFFSSRKEKDKEHVFCNIHSWILSPNHRLYSFYLISNLINERVNLTAFTPVETLKGLLNKLGFKKIGLVESFIVNLNFLLSTDNNFSIKEKEKTQNLFTIELSKKSKNMIIIQGSLSKRKGFKVFKILTISDMKFFQENHDIILNLITKKYKVYFFSEYQLNSVSIFPKKRLLSIKKRRDIFVRSSINLKNIDIFNSDLAF